jgi:hypothetical protein
MRFDVVGEQLWRVESEQQKKEWSRVQRITSPRPCIMDIQHLSSWQYFRAATCLRRACPGERAWLGEACERPPRGGRDET